MKNTPSSNKNSSTLRVFLGLTFAISWILWIPLAASGTEVSLSGGSGLNLALLLLGAFSPSLVGILMTYRTTGRVGRRDFWRRTIDFRNIRPAWFAVILLIFPFIMALTFSLEAALGSETLSLEGAWQTLIQPSALLFFIVSMLIGGPLAEELGWRGFALDRMLATLSPFKTSLVLGSIHVAWHLPLFFMRGTSQGTMGIGTALFGLWVIQVVAGSVLFTWVYIENDRSILSALLIHFMSNATFTLIAQLGNALPLRTELIRTVITIAVIGVVLWFAEVKKGSRVEKKLA